jgi:hypothetical protein
MSLHFEDFIDTSRCSSAAWELDHDLHYPESIAAALSVKLYDSNTQGGGWLDSMELDPPIVHNQNQNAPEGMLIPRDRSIHNAEPAPLAQTL